MASLDQFINMDLLNELAALPPPANNNPNSSQQQEPVIVDGAGQTDTDGMSFAEMFRHYLAPEVAKLPPSSPALPSSSDLLHPFAPTAPENNFTYDPTASFSPSAFMPHIPGSPIGAFSPSSDNSGGNHRLGSLSPISFSDESGLGSNDWSLDPSYFSAEAGNGTTNSLALEGEPSLTSVVEEDEEEDNKPDVSAFDLATLPSLPVAPAPIAAAPTPATQSNKRQASASIAEDDDDEDDEDDDEAMLSDDSDLKSSSRNKKNRKTPKTSVAAFASATLHHTSSKSNLAPVPDWTDRPDPETYKKLNSKEKRQLRNKISARNFRHRRKEYITTLEEEISSRDTIISQLRDEVGVMRTENKDLKGEVTLLKQKWDEMMSKMTTFSTPAAASTSSVGLGLGGKLPSPAASTSSGGSDEWALDSPKMAKAELPVASGSGSRASTRRTGQIAKPNLQKDVAPTLKRSSTGSWTTAGMGMGGGYMPVHTTLLSDVNFNLSQKASPFSSQNFNPALNNLSASQMAQLPALTSHLRTSNGFAAPSTPSEPTVPTNKGTFEDFFSTNPFWLKPENVEEYRGQLYGKVAHNMAGAAAAQKAFAASGATSPPANGQLPIPAGFRPAFFQQPTAPAAALSGKEPRDVAPFASSSTSADLMAAQTPHQEHTAYVASLATRTLFSRMATAFTEAFAGTDGNLSSSRVASLLDGSARLQVVANNAAPTPVTSRPASPDVASLGLQLGGLDLGSTERRTRGVPSCHFDDVCRRWTGKGEK